jgi:hypothetical protein
MFFSEIILLIIEGYIEFLISGYLNSQSEIKNPKIGDYIGRGVGYFSLFATLIGMPLLSIWCLC